jgi:hypothetical protein
MSYIGTISKEYTIDLKIMTLFELHIELTKHDTMITYSK